MNANFKQACANRFTPAPVDQSGAPRQARDTLDDHWFDRCEGIKEAIQESLDQAFGSSDS